jgi:competence protein ComGC
MAPNDQRRPRDHGASDSPHTPRVTPMEVIIVMLVLAITAWVIVPQLSRAADGSQGGTPGDELLVLRAQIQRYRNDHKGRYPTAEDFVGQMTRPTHADGRSCDPNRHAGCLGPYLRDIPINPSTGSNRVTDAKSGRLMRPTAGWCYDEATGHIRPLGAGRGSGT